MAPQVFAPWLDAQLAGSDEINGFLQGDASRGGGPFVQLPSTFLGAHVKQRIHGLTYYNARTEPNLRFALEPVCSSARTTQLQRAYAVKLGGPTCTRQPNSSSDTLFVQVPAGPPLRLHHMVHVPHTSYLVASGPQCADNCISLRKTVYFVRPL